MSRRYGKSVTSLFVRNVRHDARADDIRKVFGRYGIVSDVYIPLDHYTREPRGFAYVQFDYREDAEEALYELDGTSLLGRVMQIHMSDTDRKTPTQMRRGTSYRGGGGSRYGSSRRRRRSYSRSRSRSPRRRRHSRRSFSKSPSRSRSRSASPPRRKNHSRSPSRSPVRHNRSPSRSPERNRKSPARSRSRSRSRSGSPK